MTINELSQKEQIIFNCIDTFIEQEQLESEQPATIKKKELETYIESEAERLSFPYQKESDSIKSYYTFSLEKHEVQIEIFYRYKSYYTRHSICLVNKSPN
ncbi:hypothetical protein [Bacillus sp. AK031]